MKIRPAHPTDASSLSKLAKTIWEETYAPINGLEHVTYMLEKFQSEPVFYQQITNHEMNYWVLEDDTGLKGYLGYQAKGDKNFLSKLYLAKEARHLGYGKALFEKIPTDKPIYLTVNKHNQVAKKRYEAWGFKVIDAVKTDIGHGYIMDDFILEKN